MSTASKTLASSFKTIIMAIVVGLLLVSLAIWGVSDAFTPKTKDAAAMVGNEKITLVEFDAFFRRRLREENKKLPERISTKQAYERGFHNQVLSQLVTEKLIQLDADTLGVDVNRADARQFVEGLGAFNNVMTGKLDETKLAQRLAQSDARQSRKQFEEDVKKALRQDQTMTSITAGMTIPIAYAEQSYKFMTESRSVKLLQIKRRAVPTPADPSDEDLKAYIEENANAYIAPEYRKFTMLRVEVSDILDDMEASEDEIKDQFDYKIKVGKLGTEETRSVSQFVANDKETADKVTIALNNNENVDEFIARYNIETPVTYNNVVETTILDPKTGELAFKIELGRAQTIEGSFGTWYSVMVTDIVVGITPDLDSERVSIAKEIQTEKARKLIYDIQDKLQTALAEGSTIEEAAKANGISAASYDFVSRIGQIQNGDTMIGNTQVSGISKEDIILKEVFTSDKGFEGDIFETTTKGIAAIRVDSTLETTQIPFEDIKDQALLAWKLRKADDALGAFMDELADRALAGESYETLAASFDDGVSVTETNMVRLTRGLPELSPQTNARLFEARIGQTIRGTGANGLDRIIGKITEVTPNEEVLIGGIASTL
ncbi:MAG: SurA N-terminal domain-containing protein, partial [Robiginitomaculum sp.]|nr:SurA N-terminal domain-containing protein [Robiginitomaculum sp.]